MLQCTIMGPAQARPNYQCNLAKYYYHDYSVGNSRGIGADSIINGISNSTNGHAKFSLIGHWANHDHTPIGYNVHCRSMYILCSEWIGYQLMSSNN